jgi:hypothetical protein
MGREALVMKSLSRNIWRKQASIKRYPAEKVDIFCALLECNFVKFPVIERRLCSERAIRG